MASRAFTPRASSQTPQRQLFTTPSQGIVRSPARNSPAKAATPAKAVSTPAGKVIPAPATPATDSPGNWRHPRLDEITQRRGATVFNGENVRTIIYNGAALVAAYVAWGAYGTTYEKLSRGSYVLFSYSSARLVVLLIQFFLLFNIGRAVLPLFRKPDNLADIPLTPGQRKLLGLAPLKTPATPGAVYSTPPRYARTPSVSGSAVASASASANKLFNTGNATAGSTGSSRNYTNSSPISGSPLFGKTRAGSGSPFSANSPYQSPFSKGADARRSSFGSPTGGLGSSASLFGESSISGTPSPGSGKRLSVGLNNKWLYEKGRRSSGGGSRMY